MLQYKRFYFGIVFIYGTTIYRQAIKSAMILFNEEKFGCKGYLNIDTHYFLIAVAIIGQIYWATYLCVPLQWGVFAICLIQIDFQATSSKRTWD